MACSHLIVSVQIFTFRSGNSRSGFTTNGVLKVLIGTNLAVFLLWRVADTDFMNRNFTIQLDNVKSGAYHTMITSAFSHVEAKHFFWNMLGLYMFGKSIGHCVGPKFLLKLYLVEGFSGSVSFLMHRAILATSYETQIAALDLSKAAGLDTQRVELDPSKAAGLETQTAELDPFKAAGLDIQRVELDPSKAAGLEAHTDELDPSKAVLDFAAGLDTQTLEPNTSKAAGLDTQTVERDPSKDAALGASGAVTAIVFLDLLLFPKQILLVDFIPLPAILAAIYIVYKDIERVKKNDRKVAGLAYLGGAVVGAIAWGLLRRRL
uniref:RHOMBOID-like protein 12, mitochondrial n=1 Tax=Erigeron canadensis TaxID=72917 RepID=UPI001CB96817|nr:RHOMBOID-like protein 12, mitochondrial [Erigeron canadensis]